MASPLSLSQNQDKIKCLNFPRVQPTPALSVSLASAFPSQWPLTASCEDVLPAVSSARGISGLTQDRKNPRSPEVTHLSLQSGERGASARRSQWLNSHLLIKLKPLTLQRVTLTTRHHRLRSRFFSLMTCSDTKELSGASSWVQAAFIRKGRTRDTSIELLLCR